MEIAETVKAVVYVVILGVGITAFWRKLSADAKVAKAAVEKATANYTAVIQDIIHMKGWYDHIKLLLRIETPAGPIGEYLIVPIAAPASMEFLTDARVTQRPILVRCCVDRSIEYAYRQYATVLGPAGADARSAGA